MMHMNKARPLYRTQWGPAGYNMAPSKVVSIPVHFVGSERSRSESATKIQRVVRGFLVRKSTRKMVGMRVELEQIENKVNDPEAVEVMRREEKERLRVGETIMNLLLRLDSVWVLHYSPLRDFRKSLIKRAIALQEMVDQMVSVRPTHEDQLQGNKEEEEEDGEGKCVGEESLVEEKGEEGEVASGVHEEGEKMEAWRNEEKMVEVEEKEDGESVGTSTVEEKEEGGQVGGEEEHEEGEKMEALGKEEKMEVEEEEEDGEGGCMGEESVGTSLVEEEDCEVKEEEGGIGCEEENCKGGRGRGDEGDGGNRELLERMMEDNEKMMEMMAQLFHRNEMQTRLLGSLTQRVEMLERAFACDKLRRKKKSNVDVKHKQTYPKNGCS